MMKLLKAMTVQKIKKVLFPQPNKTQGYKKKEA